MELKHSDQFTRSVRANIAFWSRHTGLADPSAWPALHRDRENLFRATIFGLQLPDTYLEAAELAARCFEYVFERGYWADWIPVLEQAITDCPDDELALRGRLNGQLGSLYRKDRRLDEAVAAYNQQENIARQLNDPYGLASAHLRLGQVYNRKRQYEATERYAQMAMDEFEAINAPPEKIADTLNLLGLVALGRGDWHKAETNLRRACDLFRRANKHVDVGRSLANLLLALEHTGRIDEAFEMSEEAGQIFTAYDLHLERARLYINLGTLHYRRGDLAKAEAAFRQADTSAMRRSGPVYLQSLTEMNLGNVLLSQGRIEESRPYLLKCVAGFRRVNAQIMLANSLEGLAETSIELGDRDEAIHLCEEALAIVAAIPEDAFANRLEKRVRTILDELTLSADDQN
ncbi:MAG: tetratricopeptide repeat protein [Chloroflexota bacterium]|nr:MAG: tetratricopeptide repeat protein [Chloroflexota bacterium]